MEVERVEAEIDVQLAELLAELPLTRLLTGASEGLLRAWARAAWAIGASDALADPEGARDFFERTGGAVPGRDRYGFPAVRPVG